MDILDFAPVRVIKNGKSEAFKYATDISWADMFARLDTIMADAPSHHVVAGFYWYSSHSATIINDMADKYGYDFLTVAAVMSIFSATCSWEKNIVATDTFLAAYHSGLRGTSLPGVTRNFAAIIKAEVIMTADSAKYESIITKDEPDHVRSWKTVCFYRNLTGETDRCTVDVWMWRAMSGIVKSEYRPEGWHYMMCESVIMAIADKYGYSYPETQAILWTIIRDGAH